MLGVSLCINLVLLHPVLYVYKCVLAWHSLKGSSQAGESLSCWWNRLVNPLEERVKDFHLEWEDRNDNGGYSHT